MAAPAQRERAPAKLTLSLRITGVRDDGMHLIDAEMVAIDLADTLELFPGRGLEVRGPCAHGVPRGSSNLVSRALRRVGREARVVLHKSIPTGAGLGGGSADAAAVLRWAGVSDLSVAAELGSDVPFCLKGGRARVGGIGEVVMGAALEGGVFALVVPPLTVPTVEVYRMWDRMGGPEGAAGNDLEPAALAVEPRLLAWRDALGELMGEAPRLAGSGGGWFVELAPDRAARMPEDGCPVTVGDTRAALRLCRPEPPYPAPGGASPG